MRLWSLHPEYLDAKGLVALWREALLARKVLLGETKGYKNHPQLDRFRAEENPVESIDLYLSAVYHEAMKRGYHFDNSKIPTHAGIKRIKVTEGQIIYEAEHLQKKLLKRDPVRIEMLKNSGKINTNPLFIVTKGDVEHWERIPYVNNKSSEKQI